MPYLEDVRRAALEHCPGFLYELLPEGTVKGHYYKSGSLQGGRGESLSINTSNGRWGEFNGGPTGGDLISLYATVKSIPYKQALHELAARWGIKRAPRVQFRPQDWTAVLPVPGDAYPQAADSSPQLPEGILSEPPTRWWVYLDQQYQVLSFRARYSRPDGKKDFRPLSYWRHVDGHMEWLIRDLPAPRPLYNLQMLTKTVKLVLVVEGEKVVDSAVALLPPDWWVTTWPGGAQGVAYADWQPVRVLSDARLVLWPDKDRAGEAAMNAVAKQLAYPVEVVETDPRWHDGYDIADLQKDGWTGQQILEYLNSHSIRLVPESPPERVEVILHGSDVYAHMEAIWDALPQTKAPLYTTPAGPSCLRRNIHKAIEIERLEPDSFRAFLRPYLRTMRHGDKGCVDFGIRDELATGLLFNMNGHVPPLEAVYHTPMFLPDGKLVDTPGFHDTARAWVSVPEGYVHGMDIEQAWEVIGDFLYDFPFELDCDRTNAISFVVTGLMRKCIDGPTPLYRFEAPMAGTGKSLLCQALSEILCPYVAALIPSDNEEESRKRMVAALLSMPTVTVFDNVEKFDNVALKVALTSDRIVERIMREHKQVEIPIRTLWACTVNNPVLSPEMFRRSVRVRLNAKVAHPETRDPAGFRHPEIISYTRKNRGTLISAFVSIVEFGFEAKDTPSLPRLGGYERWIATVGPVLSTNGYEAFLGNLDEDRRLTEDSQSEVLSKLIQVWWEQFHTQRVSPSRLAELASRENVSFLKKDADGKVSPRSIGWYLSRFRGAVIDGLVLNGPAKMQGERCFWLTGKPEWETSLKDEQLNGQTDINF